MGLQGVDEIQHEDPKLRGSEPGAGGDTTGGGDKSGVDSIDTNGARQPIGVQAELQDKHGLPLDLGRFNKDPVRHGLEGFDQVKQGLSAVKPSQAGRFGSEGFLPRGLPGPHVGTSKQ